MSPLTRLYRRSRAVRVFCSFLMVPATLLVWVISDGMWTRYSEVGTLILFLSFLAFAAWAWWYGECRDRRQAAESDGR